MSTVAGTVRTRCADDVRFAGFVRITAASALFVAILVTVQLIAHDGRPPSALSTGYEQDGADLVAQGPHYVSRIDSSGAVIVSAGPSPGHSHLALVTTNVWRGKDLSSSPHIRTQGDGTVDIDRGAVRERVRSVADGVEQSWEFVQKPEARGDLIVRVAARGASYERTTSDGLVFSDPPRGDHIRVGHAVWVGASGARTPIPAAWDRDAIVYRVPDEIVEQTDFPAILDPLISPELGIDPPVPGLLPETAISSSIASDGTNFLVVWLDGRRENGATIFGARMSASGTVLDPVGFEISRSPLRNYTQGQGPSVAFNGTNYLVVWEDVQTTYSADIYGARVSPGGVVLDGDGIAIATTPNVNRRRPHVASDGSNWLVAWEEIATAVLVKPDGTIGTPATIPLGGGIARSAAVASNGSEYLVAFQYESSSYYGVGAVRVSAQGAAIDTAPFQVFNNGGVAVGNVTATSNARDFLVAWEGSNRGIRSAVVTAGGVPSSPAAVTANGRAPTASYDGANFVIAWEDYRSGRTGADVYCARVDRNAQLIDLNGVWLDNEGFSSFDQSRPAIAFGGGTSMVAWTQTIVPQPISIYAARFTSSGTAPDVNAGFSVSTDGNQQRYPAAAFDGTNYLVVWRDRRRDRVSNNFDLYGARVAQDGTVLDPRGILIALDAIGPPDVAFDGTNYFVAWNVSPGTCGTRPVFVVKRVSTAGTVIDASPISLGSYDGCNDTRAPVRIACGGGECLAVFAHRGSVDTDLWGARVSAGGTPLDPTGIAISTARGIQDAPSVGFDGTDFIVAWRDTRVAVTSPMIYGARVAVSGAVLDSTGIAVSAAGPSNVSGPTLDCVAQTCFATWASLTGGASAIVGARVTAAGRVLDLPPLNVASLPSSVPSPAVRWDGTSFVVAWSQPRLPWADDLFARLVALDGGMDDAGPFAASIVGNQQPEVRLAANGSGESLLVFSRLDLAPPFGDFRVRMRLLGGGPWVDGGVPQDGGAPGDAGLSDAGSDVTEGGAAADADPGDGNVGPPPQAQASPSGGCALTVTRTNADENATALGVALLLAYRIRSRTRGGAGAAQKLTHSPVRN